MTTEILNNLKSKYEKKKTLKEEYEKLKEELDALKENETVKKYLELNSKMNSAKYTKIKELKKEEILDKILDYKTNILDDSENIVMFCGKYKLTSRGPIKTEDNDHSYDYKVYVDIESTLDEAIWVAKNECSDYERTHVILKMNKKFTKENYDAFRRRFYKSLFNEGIEKAYTKVINKYMYK